MQILNLPQFLFVFFLSNPGYSIKASAQLLVYNWKSSLDSTHKNVKAEICHF